ncbi:MAG: hypothetical protein PF693_00170 [Spirochaetia bacterium]|jgi:hypothetical protein|nr:hypothetical protein [Spirochaetia bacterium]
MKKIAILLLLIPLFSCVTTKSNTDYFAEDLNGIAEIIYRNTPIDSNVLILDFTDLNGIITHFGRYLSERTYVKLSQGGSFNVVDRNNVELILKEQTLQQSGVIDEATIAELGNLVGANIFIKGVLTEFKDSVDVEISIIDISKGTIIGGDNYQINKTQEVSELIGTIVKSEEEIQKELEIYKQNILEDIEGERTRRLAALKDEENRLKTEIDTLEADMRNKSIIISEYEEKKKAVQEKDTYIQELQQEINRLETYMKDKAAIIAEYEEKKQAAEDMDVYILQLHKEINLLNADIQKDLKIGMTLAQVKEIIGGDNLKKENSYRDRYITGRYVLLFEGDILIKGVLLGSKASKIYKDGVFINSASDADLMGINSISY